MILAVVVFLLACTSHWILDTLMHPKDLPLLGFERETKRLVLAFGKKDWLHLLSNIYFMPPFRLCSSKIFTWYHFSFLVQYFILLTQIPFLASQKRIHSGRKEHTQFLFYLDFVLLFSSHFESYDRIKDHFGIGKSGFQRNFCMPHWEKVNADWNND